MPPRTTPRRQSLAERLGPDASPPSTPTTTTTARQQPARRPTPPRAGVLATLPSAAEVSDALALIECAWREAMPNYSGMLRYIQQIREELLPLLPDQPSTPAAAAAAPRVSALSPSLSRPAPAAPAVEATVAAVAAVAALATGRVINGKTLSPYQEAILDWAERGEGNLQIAAVAGSGKTTTLVMLAQVIHDPALFLAFNKHIADELNRRLAGTSMTAKTLHAVGNAAISAYMQAHKIKLLPVNTRKYRDITQTLIDTHPTVQTLASKPEARGALGTLVLKLVDMCRLKLVDPLDTARLQQLCLRYDLDLPETMAAGVGALVADALSTGAAQALREGLIDFTDMLWLTLRWKLPVPTFQWVLVDEAQDMNEAQQELALRCVAPGGRFISVGDENQAIYGFAGADADAFAHLRERTNAQVLPLSVCYRCPPNVLDLVRDIVPQIEATPGRAAGIVDDVDRDKLEELLRDGDLVLCRMTAPLVSLCMNLIAKRRKATVRGKDVGKTLTDVVKAVTERKDYKAFGSGWPRFGECLTAYENEQRDKLAQRDNAENALEALADKCEAVRLVWTSWQASSPEELCRQIDGLFDNDQRAGIALSTVHRAKGLENGRVFILKPDKLPLSWPKQQEWEYAQELNLKYVAYTRAMQELYFVTE